jgi:hypothetical protein
VATLVRIASFNNLCIYYGRKEHITAQSSTEFIFACDLFQCREDNKMERCAPVKYMYFPNVSVGMLHTMVALDVLITDTNIVLQS